MALDTTRGERDQDALTLTAGFNICEQLVAEPLVGFLRVLKGGCFRKSRLQVRVRSKE